MSKSELMNAASSLARRFRASLISSSQEVIRSEASASASSPAPVYKKPLSPGTIEKRHRSVYKIPLSRGTKEETLIQFTRDELIQYAKDLRRDLQHQRALEVYEYMERKEFVLSESHYQICLNIIAKTKGLDAAGDYFNTLESSKKTQLVYESLLYCYCVANEEDKAKAHFEIMSDLGFVKNSSPFDNLMAMYLRLGQPKMVRPLITEMKKKDISRCSTSYSMWIQSCGCLNDLGGLKKAVEEMEADQKCRISWVTFADLAAVYTKAGKFDKAEEALKALEEKMNPPYELEPCHFLITLYAGISNASGVYRVWDLLKKRSPKVNNVSWLTMLKALSKLNNINGMKKLFAEWESTCDTYDMSVVNVMISSYLERNLYKQAEAVFNRAVQKCNGRYSKARQFLMMHLLKNNQADLAIKHLEAAVSDGDMNWTWSSELISSFFIRFEESKDVDGAEEFCNLLTKWSPLDSETYTLLIKTYRAAEKACPGMRKRMEEQGIKINEEQEGLLSKICP